MIKKLLKILYMLLALSLMSDSSTIANQERDMAVYILGRSASSIEHPIIINPKTEKIFFSKIVFPQDSRYEIFFDTQWKKFIVVKNNIQKQFLEIFHTDIYSDDLSLPIYTKHYSNFHDSLRFVTWSQVFSSLCMTEYLYIKKNGITQRQLMFTCINFNDLKFQKKEIDLSGILYNDIGMWAISDNIFILGYDNKDDAIVNEHPTKSIIINLKNFNIIEKKLTLFKFNVLGSLDYEHLALADEKNIYSYNLKNVTRIALKPKGLKKIFGRDINKKGYYAEITINRYLYDYDAFCYIPFDNINHRRILFKHKLPGDLRSYCISTKIF